MKPANYAVVRFVADTARNEPVNIGIVIWTGAQVDLRIDAAAVMRVVRENPHLDRRALDCLDEMLEAEILERWPQDEGARLDLIADFPAGPVFLTEVRQTSIDDRHTKGLEETIDRLLGRLVRPHIRKREGHPGRVTRRDVAENTTKLVKEVLREVYSLPTAETVVHQVQVPTPYSIRTLDTGIQNKVLHFGSVAVSYDYSEVKVQEEIDLALATLRDIRLVHQTTPIWIISSSRISDPEARKNAGDFENQLRAKSASLGVGYAKVDNRAQIEEALESVLTEEALDALAAH